MRNPLTEDLKTAGRSLVNWARSAKTAGVLSAAIAAGLMLCGPTAANPQNNTTTVPIPLEMRFCALHCHTFAFEGNNQVVNRENLPYQSDEKRVLTILEFTPDHVLIQRQDTGSNPLSAVYEGKMEPGSGAIHGDNWRITWGDALRSQPGSDAERDNPQLVERQRKAQIDNILSTATVPNYSGLRKACEAGSIPETTRKYHAEGRANAPDTTELCVAVLSGQAAAGRIFDVDDPDPAKIKLLKTVMSATAGLTLQIDRNVQPSDVDKNATSDAWVTGFSARFLDFMPRPKTTARGDLKGDSEICLETSDNWEHMTKHLSQSTCYGVGYAQAEKVYNSINNSNGPAPK